MGRIDSFWDWMGLIAMLAFGGLVVTNGSQTNQIIAAGSKGITDILGVLSGQGSGA